MLTQAKIVVRYVPLASRLYIMAQETLKNLLPKFIDSLKEKKRSPSTILAYRADLEQMASFLQNKNKVFPGQVVAADLDSFRVTLLAEKYTPKSVSRKLNAVKTFYRWMLDEIGRAHV